MKIYLHVKLLIPYNQQLKLSYLIAWCWLKECPEILDRDLILILKAIEESQIKLGQNTN